MRDNENLDENYEYEVGELQQNISDLKKQI